MSWDFFLDQSEDTVLLIPTIALVRVLSDEAEKPEVLGFCITLSFLCWEVGLGVEFK